MRDTIITVMTTTGISFKNCPITPDINSKGKNAANVVSDEVNIGLTISQAASFAA
jgi:hypothetical protein